MSAIFNTITSTVQTSETDVATTTITTENAETEDMFVEDSDDVETFEVEVVDDDYVTAPVSSESEVIARFKESDLSYDLSVFEKYFWGDYYYYLDMYNFGLHQLCKILSLYLI